MHSLRDNVFQSNHYIRLFGNTRAKSAAGDVEVFVYLFQHTLRHAKGLANAAWAFVTASQRDAPLFAALARTAERRLGDFSAQGLANSAWAFATATQRDALLFAALAQVTV